jgi:hypothetical protein
MSLANDSRALARHYSTLTVLILPEEHGLIQMLGGYLFGSIRRPG